MFSFFFICRSFISCSREPLAGFGSNVDVSIESEERGRPRQKKTGSFKARCVSLDTKVFSQANSCLTFTFTERLLRYSLWIYHEI